MEYYGWKGLIWLSYFHVAVPIGFCIFLLWANQLITLNWTKLIGLNLVTIIYGILLYYALGISLTAMYSRSLVWLIEQESLQVILVRNSIFVIIPCISIGAFLIMKLFRVNPSVKVLVLSIVGVIASIPVSIFLLKVTNHIGGANFIHSSKKWRFNTFLGLFSWEFGYRL